MFKTIVVGTDGSETATMRSDPSGFSERACREAISARAAELENTELLPLAAQAIEVLETSAAPDA